MSSKRGNDPVFIEAIAASAKEYRQDNRFVDRLSAWFTSLYEGNESIDDEESTLRRIELVLEATAIPSGATEEA